VEGHNLLVIANAARPLFNFLGLGCGFEGRGWRVEDHNLLVIANAARPLLNFLGLGCGFEGRGWRVITCL